MLFLDLFTCFSSPRTMGTVKIGLNVLKNPPKPYRTPVPWHCSCPDFQVNQFWQNFMWGNFFLRSTTSAQEYLIVMGEGEDRIVNTIEY